MYSVEIFTGCGGLALGLSQAGFSHKMVIELDDHALSTLLENKRAQRRYFSEWNIVNGDVSDAEFSSVGTGLDLLAGGPPCQPFSIGGRHFGPGDARNLWPSVLRAVNILRPKVFLFENVLGLLRLTWAPYLEYLKLGLSWPDMAVSYGEKWEDHYSRLLNHSESASRGLPEYCVVFRGVNMADYGVPQRRNRVIALGVRTDISTGWTFPEPTHSREALYWDQEVVGTYWTRHGIPSSLATGRRATSLFSASLNARSDLLARHAWLTVRDAIADLPEPSPDAEPIQGHRLHLGARLYPRHTGSNWDQPAKALKAGNHGVPGGENMLRSADANVRYFTLREMARLQGFPDDFRVPHGWKYPIRQLGNAVPVQIGDLFGRWIIQLLKEESPSLLHRAA